MDLDWGEHKDKTFYTLYSFYSLIHYQLTTTWDVECIQSTLVVTMEEGWNNFRLFIIIPNFNSNPQSSMIKIKSLSYSLWNPRDLGTSFAAYKVILLPYFEDEKYSSFLKFNFVEELSDFRIRVISISCFSWCITYNAIWIENILH
jgi:hypothetical protein